MLRSIYLWISLFLALSAPVFATGIDTLAKADGLAAAGNHDAAITEYKRFVCFHPGDDRVSAVQARIGKAYWQLGDRAKAIDAYTKAAENAPTEEERDERRIDLAVAHLGNKDYGSAEAILLRVSTFGKGENARQRATFCLAICHLYLEQWDNAQQELNAYFADHPAEELAGLNALLSPAGRPKYKSHRLARVLSSIVPGAGQVYAGHAGDGINALVVNAFFGSLLGGAIRNRNFVDISTQVPSFLRYYNGNRYNAGNQVDRHNKRQTLSYVQRVLAEVESLAR